MSGKHHKQKVAHHNNMSLHQPIGATKIIPLAPPAKEKSSKLKSNLQNLALWLSPRVNRPNSSHSRKQQRSECDDDDDDRSKKRGHHQILIRPRGSSLDRKQVDGRGTSSTNNCAGDLHRGWKTDDRDLISQSRSADDSLDDDQPPVASGSGGGYRYSPQHQQRQQHLQQQQRKSGSLLTTFLLYFDALLPEYFTYFPSASDIDNNGAANAVSVLERGARTVQLHSVSPIYQRHSHGSGHDHKSSSAPSTPSHFLAETSLHSSKSDREKSSNNDANTNMNHQQHWLTRERLQRVAGQVSPRHVKSMKFNSTLQAEWERFTSPFLMLAGAEVLYGEMEHVLDPETERRFANGESLLVSSEVVGKESSSTAVQFDNSEEQKDSDAHSPIRSPGDSSNKRGSRRLIAMYRQVREDFIIVGEYLCDPVLGTHGPIGGGVSVNSNNDSMTEFTPQSTFELSPRSSPQKMYGRSKSQPLTPENNRSVQFSPSRNLNQEASSDESQRQIAARSLRNTLNALIAFIDARCVLVKIHADLCCWPNAPFGTAEGSRGGNKWAMLAEQCRSTMLKTSFWTFNNDSMVQLALTKLETETKALELALLSVYHLMECDFFNCVLHVRKLHVLLRRTAQTSLQLKWIKTSLRRTLSMMKIIFDNNANESPLLSRSPSLLKHKAQKSEEAGQLEQIFSEFMLMNESGPPLAVIVVHRNAQNEREEENDSLPVGAAHSLGIPMSWTPLYMKSTLDKSRADTASAQTRNNPLVQMIRNNFGGLNENKTNSNTIQQSDSEREISWPFADWSQIEKKLTTHSGMNVRTYNICSSPNKHTPSPSNANKAMPNATSKCHIVRITDAISIIAVQGASPRTRPRQVSTLEESLAKLALRFLPENIFSASSVLQAKTSVAPRSSKNANERGENSKKRPEVSALWNGTGWSDVQRKQVLHSLGLRSKHSPVVSAPLKSPYVRRQMSRMRQRKKKKRNSLNTGHLIMFLGPELSHLI